MDSWIGSSENYNGPTAASSKTETFAYLPADIQKRDSVVKAFKVRASYFNLSEGRD